MNAKKLPSREADTAQKLIEVAIELFSAAGFTGTSIRDIAKATGMSISNIYYYFGNKDGLLLAILEHSSRNLVDSLRKVAEIEMDPLERFKLLVSSHLQLVKLHKRESKIFFLDEDHLTPEGVRVNKKFQLDILDLYRHELEILQREGYINYQHLTVLAFNVLGVVNWHLRWYRPSGPLSLDELTEEIMTFILRGVLNDPASVAESIPTVAWE